MSATVEQVLRDALQAMLHQVEGRGFDQSLKREGSSDVWRLNPSAQDCVDKAKAALAHPAAAEPVARVGYIPGHYEAGLQAEIINMDLVRDGMMLYAESAAPVVAEGLTDSETIKMAMKALRPFAKLEKAFEGNFDTDKIMNEHRGVISIAHIRQAAKALRALAADPVAGSSAEAASGPQCDMEAFAEWKRYPLPELNDKWQFPDKKLQSDFVAFCAGRRRPKGGV